MLGACAAVFNRKRSGHTRRPPGRDGCRLYQARFSRLGAATATHPQDKEWNRERKRRRMGSRRSACRLPLRSREPCPVEHVAASRELERLLRRENWQPIAATCRPE
jgi:hypothetical protein